MAENDTFEVSVQLPGPVYEQYKSQLGDWSFVAVETTTDDVVILRYSANLSGLGHITAHLKCVLKPMVDIRALVTADLDSLRAGRRALTEAVESLDHLIELVIVHQSIKGQK